MQNSGCWFSVAMLFVSWEQTSNLSFFVYAWQRKVRVMHVAPVLFLCVCLFDAQASDKKLDMAVAAMHSFVVRI